MKKSLKTMSGVTLLEIMLVLAIAGIVIAMSVRYYTQASTNQKVTAGIAAVNAVVAAVEQWKLQGQTANNVSYDKIKIYFPGDSFPKSPWTGAVLGVGADGSSTSTYNVTVATNDQAGCNLLADQMKSQPGYDAECTSNNVVVTVGIDTTTSPST